MDHTLGLQIRHDLITEVGLSKTIDRRFLSPVREDEVDQTSVGLYYENTTIWHELVRSVVGVRGDAHFLDVTNAAQPENSETENDQILSPKATLVLEPVNGMEFYVSGGVGFHSNDGRGTTTVIDPNSGERVDPVDPLVESIGAEVGLRITALPGLQSTLAL